MNSYFTLHFPKNSDPVPIFQREARVPQERDGVESRLELFLKEVVSEHKELEPQAGGEV